MRPSFCLWALAGDLILTGQGSWIVSPSHLSGARPSSPSQRHVRVPSVFRHGTPSSVLFLGFCSCCFPYLDYFVLPPTLPLILPLCAAITSAAGSFQDYPRCPSWVPPASSANPEREHHCIHLPLPRLSLLLNYRHMGPRADLYTSVPSASKRTQHIVGAHKC